MKTIFVYIKHYKIINKMIQRPQSILLSIVIVGTITILQGPIWKKKSSLNPHTICAMHAWNAKISSSAIEKTYPSKKIIYPYMLIGIIAISIVYISLYALLKHNNRRLQLRLILFTIFMFILLISLMTYFAKGLNTKYFPKIYGSFKTFKIILLLIAYTSNLAAFLFISKDEKRVRDDSIR